MRSQPKTLGHLELEEAWLGGARAGPMDLSRITQKLEVLDEYKMKDSTMRCVKYLLFMLNLIISVSILFPRGYLHIFLLSIPSYPNKEMQIAFTRIYFLQLSHCPVLCAVYCLPFHECQIYGNGSGDKYIFLLTVITPYSYFSCKIR